jgi:hypothetical protein
MVRWQLLPDGACLNDREPPEGTFMLLMGLPCVVINRAALLHPC